MELRREISWHRDGDAALAIDLRHYPLVITTWTGTPTQRLADVQVDAITRLVGRAEQRAETVVLVNDWTRAGRPPGPVRKRLADLPTPACMREHFLVVSNPAVRGAATAIRWIAGEHMRMRFVDDVRTAIREAAGLLGQVEAKRPLAMLSERYELPAPAPAQTL